MQRIRFFSAKTRSRFGHRFRKMESDVSYSFVFIVFAAKKKKKSRRAQARYRSHAYYYYYQRIGGNTRRCFVSGIKNIVAGNESARSCSIPPCQPVRRDRTEYDVRFHRLMNPTFPSNHLPFLHRLMISSRPSSYESFSAFTSLFVFLHRYTLLLEYYYSWYYYSIPFAIAIRGSRAVVFS